MCCRVICVKSALFCPRALQSSLRAPEAVHSCSTLAFGLCNSDLQEGIPLGHKWLTPVLVTTQPSTALGMQAGSRSSHCSQFLFPNWGLYHPCSFREHTGAVTWLCPSHLCCPHPAGAVGDTPIGAVGHIPMGPLCHTPSRTFGPHPDRSPVWYCRRTLVSHPDRSFGRHPNGRCGSQPNQSCGSQPARTFVRHPIRSPV